MRNGSVKDEGGGGTNTFPWDSLCDEIVSAYKAGEDIVVLQRFEELQVMPELSTLVNASKPENINDLTKTTTTTDEVQVEKENSSSAITMALEKIEFCWGRALLAAKRIAGDDDEHIVTIVESFEELFERPSEYLRVLAITADSALEVLRIHQLVEGHVSTEAVTAALHKFPSLDATETREILEFLRHNDVALTKNVMEQLEKHFVMRMKTEDAEDVFREMIAAGVHPMSTRPYNFIFMKTTPFKHMGLINYYEDMLDRGITPENSTFRILSRQTQNDGHASYHFSSLAWGNAPQHRRRDEEERGSTQVFFAARLEELARTRPEATLEDALQVFRRMEVEGTSVTNGSAVLSALLVLFCRQGHPEDTERVLQLAHERGCRPTSATVQKILKSNNADRFSQAEVVLQRVVEAGDVLQVDCVDLLRYFVMSNVRNKAVRVFRAFVVQAHRHPNELIPFAIASVAMKIGPFDWALGVLAILLASVDKPLGRGVQSRMRYAAHDSRSREILAVLERCEWKRDRLLLTPELQDHTPYNNNNNNNNNNHNNNNNNSNIGGNSGVVGSGSVEGIGGVNNNTKNGSEMDWMGSSNHNSQQQQQQYGRLDGWPSWMSAMHVALMEMSVPQEVMDAYKSALIEAIEKARRHRNSNPTA